MTYQEVVLALNRPQGIAVDDETLMGDPYICVYCHRGFTYTGDLDAPSCPVRNKLLGLWAEMRRDVFRPRR